MTAAVLLLLCFPSSNLSYFKSTRVRVNSSAIGESLWAFVSQQQLSGVTKGPQKLNLNEKQSDIIDWSQRQLP